METRLAIFGRIVKSDARPKVVCILAARTVKKRQNQRIQLVRTTNVFDVCIYFISQTQIQSQLRSNRYWFDVVIETAETEVEVVNSRWAQQPRVVSKN